MSSTFVSNTYTTTTDIDIPDNAVSLYVKVHGARGGNGNSGGSGGQARVGEFYFNSSQNFVARTLTVYPGVVGGNGGSPGGGGGGNNSTFKGGNGGTGQYSYQTSYSCPDGKGYCDRRGSGLSCDDTCKDCFGSSAYCGGSQSNGDACCGGAQGTPSECFCCYTPNTCYNTITVNTGGGGGGGSASGFSDNINGVLAIAGGGGGGGGFSSNGNGADAADWTALTQAPTGAVGSNGSNRGSGGGTGGGGGGYGTSVGWQGNAGSAYNSSILTLNNTELNTNDPYVTVEYDLYTPEIVSFTGQPEEQKSSGGTPLYETTLNFNLANWQYAQLSGTGITTQTFYPGDDLSYDITNLPQSDADGTSPATRTYTLQVWAGSETVTEELVIYAYNDNTPSNSWETSFSNLDPSDLNSNDVVVLIGTLSGVDMPTIISVSGNTNFISKSATGGWGGSVTFANGDNVYVKTSRMPFNTDLSNLASDAVFGKTNSKTVTVTAPDGSFDITFITRAPKIQETFNYSNAINKYPYEDIDLINNNPLEYTASAVLEMDDIEIPMEIKLDDPDAQVSINSGNWQNVREI